MPELRLGLNDKVMFESTGRSECALVVGCDGFCAAGDGAYALAYPEGAATYPAYAFALFLHHHLTTLVSTSPSDLSRHHLIRLARLATLSESIRIPLRERIQTQLTASHTRLPLTSN